MYNRFKHSRQPILRVAVPNEMKNSFIKIITLFTLIVPLVSFAQRYYYSIGIIIGSPTGFTGKYLFSKNNAVAVNAGWSLFRENAKLHITCDYQFLFPTTLRWQDEFEGTTREIRNLTPYLGLGGRLLLLENDQGEAEINIGIRMGGGIEYNFSRFGLFLELYPVVNIIPSTDFDFEGGLGFRYYF